MIKINFWNFIFEGYFFIWSNRQSDKEFMEKRLDKVLVTEFWLEIYFSVMSRINVGWIGLFSDVRGYGLY